MWALNSCFFRRRVQEASNESRQSPSIRDREKQFAAERYPRYSKTIKGFARESPI
jgi:hypothetical protein